MRTRLRRLARHGRRPGDRLGRTTGRRGPAARTVRNVPRTAACPPSIRYTEYGIPHIVAKDYANLGFGTGWAQAADQVCVLADGFVTVRGERSRYFGPDAAPDGSLSSATKNLSSDLYFHGVRDAGTVEKLLAEPAPAGPSRQVEGPDARLGGRLQRLAGAEPDHRPGVQGRRLGAAGDRARRGRPRLRAVRARRPGPRRRRHHGRAAARRLRRPGHPYRRPPVRRRPQAGPSRAELLRTDGADMGSNAVAFSGSHHGERPRSAARQPALSVAGRPPLLAVAADDPGRAERLGRLAARHDRRSPSATTRRWRGATPSRPASPSTSTS